MDKQEFLNIIKTQTSLDEKEAERLARAVLLTLNSQLSRLERADIHGVLPKDLDTLFHGSWLQTLMSGLQSLREFDKEEFVEQVRERADLSTTDEAANIIRIVFSALKEAIPQQEVEHINRDLPDDVRDLWRAA
ncbi:MAG: DUF2267 domain-containing protein [Firmicutes bacterium]|nr:DUF2267 domain-containing protein [Bacillota bacterium]